MGARNVRRVPLGVDLDIFHPLEPIAEPAGALRGAADRSRHLGAVPDGTARAEAPRSHVAVPAGGPDDDLSGAAVNLVLVSRLSREKHPGRAIEALRLLVHAGIAAQLTVIGDGPLRERLQQRAAGLPVQFLGHVTDRAVMADLVARADVAVCPSPAETFGLAVLEALACGTPVVVPRDGAARELLGPVGSGIECDGTPDGLAAGVQALLRVPAVERRRAARLSAERFPWSATVTGMLELYAGYLPTAQAAG
ncbi:glycosyltransferase [Nocardia stercoris]|uniref:Glycosyltransferase n=1 Tax=Nocardia stercoris TaxID=2483361 RepID=A0A3M2KU76_9NOCA|nr:glycosyltransferase [Nocardia stercoris]